MYYLPQVFMDFLSRFAECNEYQFLIVTIGVFGVILLFRKIVFA